MRDKNLRLCLALLLTVISSSLPLHAQSRTRRGPIRYADKLLNFEQFVKERMATDKLPGLTIGFIKDGYTWVKGFGYADIENKVPATAESAYRLASITKTMTGAAIVQLVERGKMKLDEEIQTYVPYYPKQKWPVTVRQLLVHLGGGQTGSGIGPEYVTPRDVVARIAKYPIQNEPGVKFDYQTSGYNLLGAAIEEVSGKSFGDYLSDNLWKPIGMKNTRMDNVRELIPNRVQGYQLVNGEIRNAPFLDVSSRFGGGGATGTVPDLLRWASSIENSGVLSHASVDLMFTPVANKAGRFVGLDDGAWYYTLGWLVFPVNGQYVFYNDGGQIGTNTMVLHIPSQNLTIAFACNLQTTDRMPYVKKLYEIITGQSWDISISAKDKVDEAVLRGMNITFNYGSLHFEKSNQTDSHDPAELAEAFRYFNNTVDRNALLSSFEKTLAAINDGRHPVGGLALIKVGSYMAKRLREKYGPQSARIYHAGGAIPFFADYIEMYKNDPRHPAQFRFSESFEKSVERWNRDWTRSWTTYTQRFSPTVSSDLDAIELNLSKLLSGAEIYPNLISRLLELRQAFEGKNDWEKAARTAGLTARLYPHSDVANTYYAISLILVGRKDESRDSLKKAISINPRGMASAGVLNQIALALIRVDKRDAAIEWLGLAAELYPNEAAFYGTLGDVHRDAGRRDPAIEAYKKALDLDPKFEHAKEMLKKLGG